MTPSHEPGAIRTLAESIARDHAEIERRWLERAQRAPSAPDAGELTELRDGLPEYLGGLASLLAAPGPDLAGRARDAWSRVAAAHDITRVRAGFDIGRLVRELMLLRQVIREVAVERGVSEGAEPVLADAIAAAIGAAVEAYVDERDRETRRRQAEYVAFLTHELRNPLGTAMLTTSLLRKRVPAEQATLEKLDRSHRRLSEMIDGVLLTERLESGTVEARPSDVSLAEIVALAMEIPRSLAARRGLGVHVGDVAGARIRVDPVLTRTAIQNLVESAVRFARGGEVDVTVEASPDAVFVHVRNSCSELSDDERRAILEPFEGAGAHSVGAGLGLVVARRAAEAQGGAIHAEPESATGCHFWIELPRCVALAGAR